MAKTNLKVSELYWNGGLFPQAAKLNQNKFNMYKSHKNTVSKFKVSWAWGNKLLLRQ